MNFVTATIVALSDRTEAAELFDQTAGMAILQSAFDLSAVDVQQVDSVTVREGRLTPTFTDTHDIELQLSPLGGAPSWDGRARVLGRSPLESFDATLRLSIATSTRQSTTEVTDVRSQPLDDVFQMAEVDARILAEDGALPPADELEERRREALLARMLDAFQQPDDWDTAHFLSTAGDTTVAGLIRAGNPPHYASNLAIDLVTDPDVTPRSLTVDVDIHVVVEEQPLDDLRPVLQRIAAARGPARRLASQPSPPEGIRVAESTPVVVFCEESSFDDNDLPLPVGSNPGNADDRRAARVVELNRRMAGDGITFIPV